MTARQGSEPEQRLEQLFVPSYCCSCWRLWAVQRSLSQAIGRSWGHPGRAPNHRVTPTSIIHTPRRFPKASRPNSAAARTRFSPTSRLRIRKSQGVGPIAPNDKYEAAFYPGGHGPRFAFVDDSEDGLLITGQNPASAEGLVGRPEAAMSRVLTGDASKLEAQLAAVEQLVARSRRLERAAWGAAVTSSRPRRAST